MNKEYKWRKILIIYFIYLFCLFVYYSYSQTAIISGKVIDRETFNTVSNARIIFYDTTGIKEIFSNDTGYFIIQLPPGSYSVRIMKEGYPLQYFEPSFNTDLPLFRLIINNNNIQDSIRLDIKLTKSPREIAQGYGYISGIVLDTLGKALENINVIAYITEGREITAEYITNFEGKFCIKLPAIPHYISFNSPLLSYPNQFWNSTAITTVSPTYNSILDIKSNDTIKISVVMQKTPVNYQPTQQPQVITIKGQLFNSDSTIFNKSAQIIISDEKGMRYERNIDSIGCFYFFEILSSSYKIKILADGYPIQYYSPFGNTDFPVYSTTLADTTMLFIKLTKTPKEAFASYGYVSGFITDSLGLPAKFGDVSFVLANNNEVIIKCPTDERGYFIAKVPVLPLFMFVEYNSYPKQYYSSLGNVLIPDNNSIINPLGNDTLRFTMRLVSRFDTIPKIPKKIGAISGVVLDQNKIPIANAKVFAVPTYYFSDGKLHLIENNNFYSDSVDNNGFYKIDSLSPGDYWIYAKSPNYVIQFFPQTDFPEFASWIHIDTQEISNINFTLRIGGNIKGIVKTKNEIPVEGIYVTACRIDRNDICFSGKTNINGEFIISGLNSGFWHLNVNGKSYTVCKDNNSLDYYVEEGKTIADANIYVVEGGFISGIFNPPINYQDSLYLNHFTIALFPDSIFVNQSSQNNLFVREKENAFAFVTSLNSFASEVCSPGRWHIILKPNISKLFFNSSEKIIKVRAFLGINNMRYTDSPFLEMPSININPADTTRNISAEFALDGVAFLGTIQAENNEIPNWINISACIKNGPFIIPIADGYMLEDKKTFQISGLLQNYPYFIRVEAEGYPPQYFCPSTNDMNIQPIEPYMVNIANFTPPIIYLKKNPSGYIYNYAPISLNAMVGSSNKLIIQWDIDPNLQADTMILYSKNNEGLLEKLVTLQKTSGVIKYSWTEERDWINVNYNYVLIAKGKDIILKSNYVNSQNFINDNIFKDSLGLFLTQNNRGICLSWFIPSKIQKQNSDSIYIYKTQDNKEWNIIAKIPVDWNYTDEAITYSDVGKTFSYKIELIRNNISVVKSLEKKIVITEKLINQLGKEIHVGPFEVYKTIQSAIDAANDGDEIIVYPSVYYENLNLKGKNISINGDWRFGKPPIIDAMGGTAITVPYSKIKSMWQQPSIHGFKIQNAVIGINSFSDIRVDKCLFTNIAKSCIIASFDSISLVNYAMQDPFVDYNIDINIWGCTFSGKGTNGLVAILDSRNFSNNNQFTGLEQNIIYPPLLFNTILNMGNSIIYNFYNTQNLYAIEKKGTYATIYFKFCDFWDTPFETTSTTNCYYQNPNFIDNDYYFLADNSPFYSMGENNSAIGYDVIRKWYYSNTGTNIKPSAVKDLKVFISGPKQITLTWGRLPAQENIKRYIVYRVVGIDSLFYVNPLSQWDIKIPQDSIFKLVDTFTTSDTFFIDTSVLINTPYIYRVAGISQTGEIGEVYFPFPPPLSSYIIKIVPLYAIKNINVSLKSFSAASIFWQRNKDLSKYKLYRIKLAGNLYNVDTLIIREILNSGKYLSIDSFIVSDTNYLDTGLQFGFSYVYIINSSNISGNFLPLKEQELVFSYIENGIERFKNLEKINIPAQQWIMIGPWGNNKIILSSSNQNFVYKWDDFKQPDKLLSQYSVVSEMKGGEGYWIYSEKDTQLNLNLDSLSLSQLADSEKQQNIKILKGNTGWNQISTILPYPIFPNWLNKYPVYEWLPQSNQYVLATQLKPWKAYWIYTEKDTSLPLYNLSEAPILYKRAENIIWELKVELLGKNCSDRENYCGLVDKGNTINNEIISPKPPQAFDFPQVFFVSKSQNQKQARLYKSYDSKNSQKLEFTVGITPYSEEMRLSIKGIENIPQKALVLFIQNNMIYDLRKTSEIPLPAHKETVYGYIVVTSNIKDVELYTGKFGVKKVSPNPFKNYLAIEFLLPYNLNSNGVKLEGESRNISLNIFNISGQCVKTIINKNNLPVGYHKVVWDGNNNSGKKVSNGFYLIELKGEKVKHTVRLFKIN